MELNETLKSLLLANNSAIGKKIQNYKINTFFASIRM